VELRARRRVVRSYLAVRDLLDAMIGWLLAGGESEQTVLDTCGEPVEVGELAVRILKVLNRAELPIKRPPLESGPDDFYVGAGARFEHLAQDQSIRLAPLEEQISDTASYLEGLRA
jgi:hypothetical protein